MLDHLRIHRTTLEMNAGLREKIRAARKAARLSEDLYAEIEAAIKKKDLDRNIAYGQA